jgi:AcrR family transcriptional regulator
VVTTFIGVMPPADVRTRMSADARREEILNTAVSDFALGGLHGTSTEAIAERAGISQPYLFRLFGTKKDLFIACIGRCFDRTEGAFRAAAEADEGGAPLEAMGQAYIELLADRELLLSQMQTYAACGDDEIRVVVRRRWGELYRTVERLSGAPADEVRAFFATGMLLNVAAAIDLPEIAGQKGAAWARRALHGAA